MKKTIKERTASALLCAMLAVSMMPAPAFAAGAESQGASLSTGVASSLLENDMLETQSYDTAFAVVDSDGMVYRADSSGAAIGSTWGDKAKEANEALDGVQVLYVNPDVVSLSNLKYSYNSGKNVLTEHVELAGVDAMRVNLGNLQKIVFLTDEYGQNACEAIPKSAFEYQENLTEVVNLDKTRITSIPEYAFYKCEQLQNITLPSDLDTIDDYAFDGCSQLGSIDFGSSLRSIGKYAFKGCYHLGAGGFVVDLPATLTSIGMYAFQDCECLHTIILRNSDTTVSAGDDILGGSTNIKRIYVHNSLLSSYLNSSSTKAWNNYRGSIRDFLEVGSVSDAIYTGEPYAPVPPVTWMGQELDEGYDFTVYYWRLISIKASWGAYQFWEGVEDPTEPGFYCARIDLNDDYDNGESFEEQAEYTFHILRSLEDAQVSVTDQIYTGRELEPAVTVTLDGCTVPEDQYTVKYSNNTECGTATVTITGTDNYIGSASATFAIKQPILKLSKTEFIYNGETQKPEVTVTGFDQLEEDVDYTLRYSSPSSKSVGAYTVKAIGMGEYAGMSLAGKYTIAKTSNALDVKVTNKTAKHSKTKQKMQEVSKAITAKNAQGKVTYAKIIKGSSRYLTIDKATGAIKVKRGTKKGTYKMNVKVTAAGNANYLEGSKTVQVKVHVK